MLLAVGVEYGVDHAEAHFQLTVVQAAIENVTQRFHRRVRNRAQVVDEIELRFQIDHAGVGHQRVELCHRHIDDRGALRPHSRDGGAHGIGNLGVGIAEVRQEQANARPTQRVLVQRCLELRHWLIAKDRSDRVFAVVAHAHIERDGEIGHGARQRATDVLRVRQRHDTATAHQPLCGTQANEGVEGTRNANRAARIRTPAHCGKTRGDGRTRTAARATGASRGVVRIACLSAE